jgi:tRNA(Ile)-lysidine synthase
LDLLHQLSYPLVVAHLDHGLRPESEDEARQVEQVANRLGLPFVMGREDVARFAGDEHLSIEEAARLLRYRFLFDQASQFNAQAVAVGHNADDQVETVLMHLLRGSGLAGLKGMAFRSLPTAWSPDIPLVRPLLGFWREEILAYAAERGLQPAQDASNLDRTFYRNRLRHELIPTLESYQPRLRQLLWRMAPGVGGDEQVLEQLVEQAWTACRAEASEGRVSFAAGPLRSQPVGIQRRLLRRAIASLRPGLRDVDYQAVERGLEALASTAPRAQSDLVSGLRLFLEGERVWIAAQELHLPGLGWPQVPEQVVLQLDVPGAGPAGVAAGSCAGLSSRTRRRSPLQTPFRPGSRRGPAATLQVRRRRPGDRFKPFWNGGPLVEAFRFMINVKLPGLALVGRW